MGLIGAHIPSPFNWILINIHIETDAPRDVFRDDFCSFLKQTFSSGSNAKSICLSWYQHMTGVGVLAVGAVDWARFFEDLEVMIMNGFPLHHL